MRIKLEILLSLAIIIFVSSTTFGQRIKGAIIAGGNFSQVDGDFKYGYYKAGLNLGAAAIVPLGGNFSFILETIFNQKGSYQSPQYNEILKDTLGNIIKRRSGQYKLKLDYLEVPMLLQYTDKDVISAGIGFSYGRLVNVKEYEHDSIVLSSTLNSGTYNRNDYNVLFDLQFRIHRKIPKLKFNVRYAYSISNIRVRDYYDPYSNEYFDTRKYYNNLITFRLIYVFNEKPVSINP